MSVQGIGSNTAWWVQQGTGVRNSSGVAATGTSTGGTTALNGGLAQLQQDFQTLVGALNPSAGSSSGTAPGLLSFLQNLATDPGANRSAPGATATGSLVDTAA
jgi:S-formylglutathione hydrolase FrmB